MVVHGSCKTCPKNNFAHLSRMSRRLHSSSVEDIDQFKKFLGSLAKGYNEAQVRQPRREMDTLVELLLELYLAKKKGESPKRQTPRFDTEEPRP